MQAYAYEGVALILDIILTVSIYFQEAVSKFRCLKVCLS